jgi:hypothetical protein
MAPVPVPTATRAEAESLIKALQAAKEALGEQRFPAADLHLKQAETLARLPKHQDAVARLKLVGIYVKQFRDAVDAAVEAMQGAENIKVGTSAQVGFVDKSPGHVVFRVAGVNKNYERSELPPALALAVAERKLPQSNPASLIVKGAYLLVHKQPDADTKAREIEKAKTLWQEAEAAGGDVARLLPFLTEDYAEFIKDAT